MAIDPDRLLAMPPIITRQTLRRRDTILYGIGATEFDFLFEERLKALPTMAVTLGYPGFIWRDPALGANWQNILHGEQSTILHRRATYGVIVSGRCGDQPAPLKRIDGRFSSPVYPGETIETSIWDEGSGKLAFRARVVERDKIIFTNGYAETA